MPKSTIVCQYAILSLNPLTEQSRVCLFITLICLFGCFAFQPAALSCKFSTSSSRLLKFYNSGEEAVKEIPDGAKLLVGGEYYPTHALND